MSFSREKGQIAKPYSILGRGCHTLCRGAAPVDDDEEDDVVELDVDAEVAAAVSDDI